MFWYLIYTFCNNFSADIIWFVMQFQFQQDSINLETI